MSEVIRLSIRIADGPVIELKGRFAWALAQLFRAGERGITPIDRPAPRWSHYIDILRDKHGIAIETIEERHGGPFKGWHGRYVLRSKVDVLDEGTS